MNLSQNPFAAGMMLLVDKPVGWTSFDVVNKIRRLTHAKTGHSGTLDPLATGLLICCTGKKTRELASLQGLPKTYSGILRLGATTPSDDLETEPDQHRPFEYLHETDIIEMAQSFIGIQQQIPPMYAAIKKQGVPLYRQARQGLPVEREPRPIQIMRFDITRIEMPFVHFEVTCSSGTYIRALARDMGEKLGCGAYLYALRRLAIGPYHVQQAHTIQEWERLIRQQLPSTS
ncbi:MAG: tRNA pseudouridine(55) synthase TruB [Thermoflavifilum sp.]|nr:tRNA pseudouridine(55) synthase TruB [Thermoflavifilum sp.]